MDTSTADGFKQARAALGLSQHGLAAILGRSRPAIARYEAGDEIPAVVALALRCLLLDAGKARPAHRFKQARA